MLNSLYNGYDVHLIESVDELQMVRDLADPKVQVGIDTETSGLDFYKDRIAGVCISVGHGYSKGQYHGFYIPVRHYAYANNLPIDKVVELTQWLIDNFKTCFFNRNFDLSMLEFDGLNTPFVGGMHDAQIMVYEAESAQYPALKPSVKKYLKFDVLDFESNNAKDHNFMTTDPRVSYVYAAQDPLVTVLLARHMWFNFPYIQKIYPIDNKATEAMRRFSRDAVLPLDFEILQREYDKCITGLQSTKAEIVALCGYDFNVNSPTDKADALSRFVTLTEKTASGKFAVGDDVLKRIDHPLARLLQKYAELEKFRGTYLSKMLDFPKEGIHVNYGTTSVATGRMSSGAYKGNSYFANFNIQNVPKVEVMRYVHTDPTIGYIVNDEPEGAICQMKVKGGLRDAFIPPEGYIWIAADYSAEEMRVMANLSGEPNLINPMLNGEDIHNYVAKQMFGFADKHHRTRVKILNFACAYGAGAFSISQQLGISQSEAQELLDKYNATLASLTRWKEEQKKKARRDGVLFTYFGRPRDMHSFYASSERKDWAYGDRTAMNSPVQGFGGDLIRIDHVKLMNKILTDPEFAENVKYSCTVHDEIDLYVKPSYLYKCFKTLTGIMDFAPSNFKVPIVSSPSVGLHWGVQVECEDITPNNRIIINLEKCEPLDGQTQEEMEAAIKEWESQPNY